MASQAYQENKQVQQKAIEVTKFSATNKRLRRRVLGLELGQHASVLEAGKKQAGSQSARGQAQRVEKSSRSRSCGLKYPTFAEA